MLTAISVCRFAGPATAVDYPRLLTARLGVRAPRTAGEGVAEAAWRLQRLVLPPGQLAALGSRHRLAYVYGPPGTGAWSFQLPRLLYICGYLIH